MADMELFVVETADQVHKTESDALVQFLDDASCENCDVVVGFHNRKFFPCVLCVKGEEDVWAVCSDCASSVISPGE